jgi:hypothetical protein
VVSFVGGADGVFDGSAAAARRQMDWTDRHYRFMMRMITKRTLLFTEMLVDQTVRRL